MLNNASYSLHNTCGIGPVSILQHRCEWHWYVGGSNSMNRCKHILAETLHYLRCQFCTYASSRLKKNASVELRATSKQTLPL